MDDRDLELAKNWEVAKLHRNAAHGGQVVVVQYDNEGNVDFDAPVQMTPEQRSRFLEHLVMLVPSQSEVRPVTEPEKSYTRTEQASLGRWKPAELALLLSGMTKKQIMDLTGRTDMAVQAHLGWFPQAFYHWVRTQGFSARPEVELVILFMESWKS